MNSLSVTATSPLQRIGAGHCGSVWATLTFNNYPGIAVALKREDASPGRSIRNEFRVQSQVYQSCLESVLAPSPLAFVESKDNWSQTLAHLPEGFEPCNAMMSECIRPVSEASRRVLVERYCPADILPSQILNSWENEHCLVRVYLGRRRSAPSNPQRPLRRFFSLRNFPLHMDQAEELDLPCDTWAKAMGGTLATLHWKLKTDAADVEFVLGAPRDGEADTLGETPLWILDFDCCKPITMDSSGLMAIARAFWRNDPYYPRPGTSNDQDQRLWDIFAVEYRKVGKEVLQSSQLEEGSNLFDLYCLVEEAISRIEETRGQFSAGSKVL